MIAQLSGTIVEVSGNAVVLNVAGVGYLVTVSGRTQSQISLLDGSVTLLTDLVVREDSMTLFGFLEPAERDAFRLLTTVQGVGAKAAMAILSVLGPAELNAAIVSGDKAMVARADGVGPKIAQRVVNELAEKIGKLPIAADTASIGPGAVAEDDNTVLGDAMSALTNLGYGRAEAHAALMRARSGGVPDDLSALIAGALQEMGQ